MHNFLHRIPLYISREDESITFYLDNAKSIRMYHSQDCCESVYIEDINGDLDSLLFKPILQAYEKISTDEDSDSKLDEYGYSDESFTWTFYTLANISSVVVIRWYGSSNGYYSERVDLDIDDYDIKSLPNYAYIAEHHPQFLI